MKFISLNPKQLLIIDGLGALVSALTLGFILPQFESLFGIPEKLLHLLAIPPVVFFFIDMYGFISPPAKMKQLLKFIASANLAYCLLSLTLASTHYEKITLWGWGYLLIEVLVVVGLALLEFRVAENSKA